MRLSIPIDNLCVVVKQVVINQLLLHLVAEDSSHDSIEVLRILHFDKEVELMRPILRQVAILLVIGEGLPVQDEVQFIPVSVFSKTFHLSDQF